jgi:hypothetical protein
MPEELIYYFTDALQRTNAISKRLTKAQQDEENAKLKDPEFKERECWDEPFWPSWSGRTSMESTKRYHEHSLVGPFNADTCKVLRDLPSRRRPSSDILSMRSSSSDDIHQPPW